MAVKRVTTVARPAQTTHDVLARRHSCEASGTKGFPKGKPELRDHLSKRRDIVSVSGTGG